jgi:deoxycytidylate deaminase
MDIDARPEKLARTFMEIELASQWATCQRGLVGSALVDFNWVTVVSARNGTPFDMDRCEKITTPEKKCEYCVHSERNVINHAARLGIGTQSKTLVTLRRPCINCASDIVQAGIAAVYYRWPYFTDELLGGLRYVEQMFERAHIYFVKVLMTEQEQSFHNMLEEWRKTWTTKP